MESTALDTIRDLYNKCVQRLEFLCQEEPYAQHAWDAEYDRLRYWGQNLDGSPRGPPTLLEEQLRTSLPLQNSLLEALEGLFTGLKSFADTIQRKDKNSFKIAGIDVLSAGAEERENARLEDITRRLSETSRDITSLYTIFSVPRPFSNGRLMPRPQRSYSNRDEPYDHNDASSSASVSPMAPPGRGGKRSRGDSQSSRDESGYSSSAYRVSSSSSDALSQRAQDLPSIHSLPPRDSLEPSPYEQHVTAGPRMGPYYGPPAGLQHAHHTSMYPMPPKSPYAYARPHDPRGDESFGYHEVDPLSGHSPQSERTMSRGATRSLGRLRIPADGSDDSASSSHTTKLTKTGRVSKALRGEPVHACTVCDKVYTRAEHLRRHRANHRT